MRSLGEIVRQVLPSLEPGRSHRHGFAERTGRHVDLDTAVRVRVPAPFRTHHDLFRIERREEHIRHTDELFVGSFCPALGVCVAVQRGGHRVPPGGRQWQHEAPELVCPGRAVHIGRRNSHALQWRFVNCAEDATEDRGVDDDLPIGATPSPAGREKRPCSDECGRDGQGMKKAWTARFKRFGGHGQAKLQQAYQPGFPNAFGVRRAEPAQALREGSRRRRRCAGAQASAS